MGEPEIQLDVLDFGGAADDRRPPRRWVRWVALGLGIAVVAVLAIQNAYRTTPSAGPSPVPSHGPTYVGPQNQAPPSATVTAPMTRDLGHPLLGVTGNWELFGLSSAGVVRVQLAKGIVTLTPVPPLNSTGPVAFTVGRDWTIIRPLDSVPGYLVPDGQPAHRLQGALDSSSFAFPGPDPDHVWSPPAIDGPPAVMQLFDANGRPAGPTISVPAEVDREPWPDGTGYLVFAGPGGVYDGRPDGLRRVTTGGLLAIGPTRWLTLECDERFSCQRTVIDRATGARHALSSYVPSGYTQPGVISPDGRFAAVVENEQTGISADLIDLRTGTETHLDVDLNVGYADPMMVWSPDSRWLFVISGAGTIVPVDTSGRAASLGVDLPAVTRLAVRSG